MEGQRPERIVAEIRAITGLVDIDSQFVILRPVLFQFRPVAGRERQSGAVVYAAALQIPGGGDQTGIVDEPASAIGLQHQRAFAGHGIGPHQLDVTSLSNHGERQNGENDLRPPQPGMERSGPFHRTLLTAQRQQNSGDQEIGQHRRAPITKKRRGHAGQRKQVQNAAGNQQQFCAQQQRQAQRKEERIVRAGAARDAQGHPDQQAKAAVSDRDAREPPFFSQHGHNQIRIARGNDVGFSQSGAGAKRTAGRHRPERVDHLVAAPHRIAPRREPHGDAIVHGLRSSQKVSRQKAATQRRHAKNRQRRTVPRDRIEGKKDRREHQRRAQIALQIEEQHRHADPQHHRRRVLQTRQLHAGDHKTLFVQLAQQRPAFREIPGQEKHQQNLDRLHRLERSQVYPRVAAGGSRSEEDQGHRKRNRSQQRHETVARRGGLPVDETSQHHEQAAARHSLRKRDEDQRVPQRIAQSHHQRESDSRKQQQQRQKGPRPGEAAKRPDQADQQEGRQHHPR